MLNNFFTPGASYPGAYLIFDLLEGGRKCWLWVRDCWKVQRVFPISYPGSYRSLPGRLQFSNVSTSACAIDTKIYKRNIIYIYRICWDITIILLVYIIIEWLVFKMSGRKSKTCVSIFINKDTNQNIKTFLYFDLYLYSA